MSFLIWLTNLNGFKCVFRKSKTLRISWQNEQTLVVSFFSFVKVWIKFVWIRLNKIFLHEYWIFVYRYWLIFVWIFFLYSQVSEPILAKTFHRKVQSKKIFTHRESFDAIIAKTEEKLAQVRIQKVKPFKPDWSIGEWINGQMNKWANGHGITKWIWHRRILLNSIPTTRPCSTQFTKTHSYMHVWTMK